MREIKFRGKRVDNGEWVYGYYAKTTLTDEPMCLGDCRIHNLIIERGTYYHVDPSTVGQYTGLKHMCNGDIIDDGFGIGIVEYVSNYAAFRVNYQNGACKWFYDYLDSELKCIEIIGNIHDNPNLLEVTE